MYVLAGTIELDVFMVHRTLFLETDDAEKARTSEALKEYTFLKVMTIAQVTERLAFLGKENTLLVPINPDLEEK